MKRYGIVSYNLHCNFTNYGSALQQYALHHVVNNLQGMDVHSVVIDYCPDVLLDKDVLNPFKNMWDEEEEVRRNAKLSMPAIQENWVKFQNFFEKQYDLSKEKYTSKNFNDSLRDENLDGYICGSDTIWCTLEFKGFDDGYFGNYSAMRQSHTIAYAASFGDAILEGEDWNTLAERLKNYKAIGVRENTNLEFIKEHTEGILVQRVLDPTLLLTGKDYEEITEGNPMEESYLLLYTRRYNPKMEEFAEKLAKENGWKIVEISLRATNAEKGHIMRYDAGVEEFLSLVKGAEYVVTNSFHGAIFAIQMHRKFSVFSREQADVKIDELLGLLGLMERKMVTGEEYMESEIDYEAVEGILSEKRKESMNYLIAALKEV